jgi:signal peptidase I
MREKLRRHSRLLSNLAALAFLGIWFFTLAPTVIGGPAGYIEVSGHSMDGTYKTGDLILTRSHDTYAKGDIIVYDAGPGQVIHRIIGGNGATGYTTQGDNNPDPDPWHPTDADVVGQAWHRFEGKAWILHLPRQPWFAGAAAGLLTLVVLGWDARPRRGAPRVEGAPALATEAAPLVVPELETAGARLIPLQRRDSTPAPASRTSRQPRRTAETPAEQAPQAEQ